MSLWGISLRDIFENRSALWRRQMEELKKVRMSICLSVHQHSKSLRGVILKRERLLKRQTRIILQDALDKGIEFNLDCVCWVVALSRSLSLTELSLFSKVEAFWKASSKKWSAQWSHRRQMNHLELMLGLATGLLFLFVIWTSEQERKWWCHF